MNVHEEPSDQPIVPPSAVIGTICGLISAVGYTGANICLRAVSDLDPIYVSAVKSAPTVLIIGPWIAVQAWQGLRVIPNRKTLGWLIFAAVLGQLGGNVLFQWALGVVGIALTVPLTLGTMILFGALLGRIALNEPLTGQTILSIACLIVAITVLSLGADKAHASVTGQPIDLDSPQRIWLIVAGVTAAGIAGVAYAVLGVVIRYGVTGRALLSTTMFTVGIAGSVTLGTLSFWRIGWTGIIATKGDDFLYMLAAGLCNTAAFLALTKALQVTTVVYVNALNATQATMAAIAGVLFFHEAPSREMRAGVLLTIVGLVLMRQRQRSVSVAASKTEITE